MNREYIISLVRELAGTYGESGVTRRLVAGMAFINPRDLVKEFGSWNKLRELAGLPPERRGHWSPFTREDLLSKLQELVRERGANVSREAFIRETGISGQVIISRWGNWCELRKAAGLSPQSKAPERFTREELLEDLWQVSQRTGREPKRYRHQRDGGRISTNTLCKRLGNWEEVKAAFAEWRKGKERGGQRGRGMSCRDK